MAKEVSLIIVHAIHRTGSTAMHRFLRANVKAKYIIHAHLLINRWHRSYDPRPLERIEKYGKKNCKVIHLVRDPVARNLSHFWMAGFRTNIRPNTPDLSNFKERFLIELDHYYPVYFVGNEVEPFWEFKIQHIHGFDSPYTIYDDRVAIIRYEDFDCRGDLLRDFFDVELSKEPPRIQCAGRAGEVNDYKEILDTIRLPKMYIDRMYASKYARTFYSGEERKILKERWTKGIKADHPIVQKQETIRDAHDPETCLECLQFREWRHDKNKRNNSIKK